MGLYFTQQALICFDLLRSTTETPPPPPRFPPHSNPQRGAVPTSISRTPSQIGIQPLTQQPPNLIPLTTTPPPLRQQHTNTHHSTARTWQRVRPASQPASKPRKGKRERPRPGQPLRHLPGRTSGGAAEEKKRAPHTTGAFQSNPGALTGGLPRHAHSGGNPGEQASSYIPTDWRGRHHHRSDEGGS